MDTTNAIRFLEMHQPLPPDTQLSEQTIKTFDEVRRHFTMNPEPKSVALMLNAFGEGDGFGVYQLVEDMLLRQDRDLVISSLEAALQSQHYGVRYWCANISAVFPSEKLVAPLLRLLNETDHDMKIVALIAIEQCGHWLPADALRSFSENEQDDELSEMADQITRKLPRE